MCNIQIRSLIFVTFIGVYRLFYFVSQQYVNILSCIVKQISVFYFHGVKLGVFYPLNKCYFTLGPEGGKVTWQAPLPDISVVSVCTATVTVHINCTIHCTATGVSTFL